ncbi:hypothetical protein FRB99_005767 [Tulasnella sp. 403]|nr:hypothetical protein FRB99_005767 [Tulasnella sp. 403]
MNPERASISPPPESTATPTPIPDSNATSAASRPSSDESGFSRDGRFSSPTSPLSPGTTTKAAFFRSKDSRPRHIAGWDADHSRSSSVDSRSRSPRRRSGQASSPKAGPSSRPPLPSLSKAISQAEPNFRASPATSIPLTNSSLTWRNANPSLNMKDELLMSLLASQAMVDSRDSEILTAEEVEELKREYTLVTSRLASATRKLSVETKIRDAAQKLCNFAQSDDSIPKENVEQLAAANQKVEAAQQELHRLSERANDLSKRLLEHRAGVLSFSVKSLEKKAAVAMGGATDTDSESSTGLSGDMSPASTAATSLSLVPLKKFDGAHLFAGHADAITPGTTTTPRVRDLEEKLRQADEALEAAKQELADVERELERRMTEKTQMETAMMLQIQSAEATITKLRTQLDTMRQTELQLQELRSVSAAWEMDKRDLEDRLRQAEAGQDKYSELENSMIQLRAELLAKDSENKRLLDERKSWEAERDSLRQSLSEHQAGANEELIVAREALRAMCRSNRIAVAPNETNLTTYVTALESHLATFDAQKEQLQETRERLSGQLEDARREREDARREARVLEAKLRLRPEGEGLGSRAASPAFSIISRRASGDDEDVDRVTAILKPIWAILPSVEARTSKLGNARSITPRSPKYRTPDSPPLSLSELDVRSLKALYDPKGSYTSPAVAGEFTIEDFAIRVQALITDDRALVERLIRFAQAHDLLKNNAERAQQLAQNSTMGLEMYQKQVKTLEERNRDLTDRQASLMDEIDDLHQALDRLEEQKRVLEEQAAEQAETCKNLNEANNTLSARTLALAAESADVPERMKKYDVEIAELKKKLEDAMDELDRTRAAESMQRVTLLDELNSLQQENGTLRNQLRLRGGL